jgi:hypothetical protein
MCIVAGGAQRSGSAWVGFRVLTLAPLSNHSAHKVHVCLHAGYATAHAEPDGNQQRHELSLKKSMPMTTRVYGVWVMPRLTRHRLPRKPLPPMTRTANSMPLDSVRISLPDPAMPPHDPLARPLPAPNVPRPGQGFSDHNLPRHHSCAHLCWLLLAAAQLGAAAPQTQCASPHKPSATGRPTQLRVPQPLHASPTTQRLARRWPRQSRCGRRLADRSSPFVTRQRRIHLPAAAARGAHVPRAVMNPQALSWCWCSPAGHQNLVDYQLQAMLAPGDLVSTSPSPTCERSASAHGPRTRG